MAEKVYNLINVCPSFPVDDIRHNRLADIELFCQSILRYIRGGVKVTKFAYLIGGQFRRTVRLASQYLFRMFSGKVFVTTFNRPRHIGITSTFITRIAHIIELISKPQVQRVNTGRVVARMANKLLIGIGAIVDSVCDSVSAVISTRYIKFTVTVFSFCNSPASGWLSSNSVPESVSDLRGNGWDNTIRFSHDDLLYRLLRLESLGSDYSSGSPLIISRLGGI